MMYKNLKISVVFVLLVVSSLLMAAPADDFVITVKTDNPGAGTNTNFIIYRRANASYNYNVDCDNDGANEATSQTGDYTCNYTVAGTYTIRIKDNTGTGDGFTGFDLGTGSHSVAKKLIAVEQWGTGKWEGLTFAFFGAINLVINATDIPDFSNTTFLSYMFQGAVLADPDTSNWNTSTITDMSGMFLGAISANPDTSNWDTSAVLNMSSMFSGATSANPNTSNWDTSAVTDMRFMFSSATSANPNTSNWDTSAVTDMLRMFYGATSANPDTSNWDISAVTSMQFMFSFVTLPTNSYENMLIGFASQNLQNNVIFSAGSSKYCSAAAQAARASLIANYNWTITDGGVCDPADDFVIRIKSDNPGGTPTEFFIYSPGGGNNFNVDCDNDGVLEAVAQSNSSYTCDYSSSGAGIYTIRIQDNTGMGTGFTKLDFGFTTVREKILSIEQWGTSKWTSMTGAFEQCSNLVINATDTANMSNVTSMASMFQDATMANPNTSNWDTSSVTDMSSMFDGASSANPDTSNWNTSNVISMDRMFRNAGSANPDVSNWDTSSVIYMNVMFRNAGSANPDVSNWDTSSVIYMDIMFANATSANPVISNWDVSSVTGMFNMFSGITLPTSEYDAILVNFSTQNLKSNVTFGVGNSQYCSLAAQAARASMISFNGWNITDGGVCPEIFQNGFESIVVTFKTVDAEFAFDFSDIDLLPEDETPKLIAKGLNIDNQINVKIYLRQTDDVLEIMQSQLLEEVDGEQLWSDGLWYEVFETGLSEVNLW